MRPTDYKHIVAWGRFCDLPSSVIRKRQKQAYDDNAPLDAMFKKDGVWNAISDYPENTFIERIQQIVDTLK